VPSPRPSRLSNGRILRELRLAARRGDRAALTVAIDQMRTLALSPRYWEKYLVLLRNPLARLVDLVVIKQGERIAQQKGWKSLGGGLRPPSDGRRAPKGALLPASPRDRSRGRSPRSKGTKPTRRRTRSGPAAEQQMLFEP
jgi:hypothetical protein